MTIPDASVNRHTTAGACVEVTNRSFAHGLSWFGVAYNDRNWRAPNIQALFTMENDGNHSLLDELGISPIVYFRRSSESVGLRISSDIAPISIFYKYTLKDLKRPLTEMWRCWRYIYQADPRPGRHDCSNPGPFNIKNR